MQLWVLAVGQRMPRWVDEAFDEYAKRMPPESRLVLKEIKPEPRHASKSTAQMMQAEAVRLHQALPAQATVIALDERGLDLTTTQVADALDTWRHQGRDVVFLIGGADGLAPELKQQAAQLWRLSSLTLPHGLARVLLAEQLYRAVTVLQGHPYHRA